MVQYSLFDIYDDGNDDVHCTLNQCQSELFIAIYMVQYSMLVHYDNDAH